MAEPNSGNTAPIAVGFSLLAAVQAAGKFTGLHMSPSWLDFAISHMRQNGCRHILLGPTGCKSCNKIETRWDAGGALNPARALGPSIVFKCEWRITWIYVLAELTGGLVAGLFAIPLYGLGTTFLISMLSKMSLHCIRTLHRPCIALEYCID